MSGVVVEEAVCLLTICQAWLRWRPQIAEGVWWCFFLWEDIAERGMFHSDK